MLWQIVLLSKGWFTSLPEAIREDVLARSRRRSLASGDRLFSRGERSDGLFCVLEGSILVKGTSKEGHETLLDFYGPGSWIGEVSALDGLPHGHDAEAHEPATLLHVGPADLEDLLAAHPALSRAVMRLEALRLRLLLAALESYSVQSMEQRLANRVLMLAVQYGASDPRGLRIELNLPQETLARLIGSTRQRVNQILKAWENAGTVDQRYGRIVVVDRGKLEGLARM